MRLWGWPNAGRWPPDQNSKRVILDEKISAPFEKQWFRFFEA